MVFNVFFKNEQKDEKLPKRKKQKHEETQHQQKQ